MAALVMVLSLVPACLLMTVRGFALSQVPLKTTAEPSALFIVLFLLCTVTDLAGTLAELRQNGCQVDDRGEESEYGKFGWVTDCEGNKIELWEPPKLSSVPAEPS